MRTTRHVAAGGRRPPPRPGDEGGFLIVMVMLVMLIVSTIAASTLVNSFLERSLAKNQNYSSIAMQAAEAGLAAGFTYVRENQTCLPQASPWNTVPVGCPAWPVTISGSLSSGGAYTVKMRYKREWMDYNGDGDCTDPGESSGYTDNDAGQTPANTCPGDFVLYNKCPNTTNDCFGFPDSLFRGPAAGDAGYPLIEVESVGTFGSGSYRQVVVDISRNKVDVKIDGALTTRSPIPVGGSGYVDGHNFADGPNLSTVMESDTCPDLPAVVVNTGLTPPACQAVSTTDKNSKDIYGPSPCASNYDASKYGGAPMVTTPWEVLGLTESEFKNTFLKTAAPASYGTHENPKWIWATGDQALGGNAAGYGILVVHNENFNPDVYDCSHPTSPAYDPTGSGACAGNYNPRADNSTAQYDPTYSPAEFRVNGTFDYHGVLIVDQLVKGNGNAKINGGIYNIGGVGTDNTTNGNLQVTYSCDAISDATTAGYGTQLGWHRIR